MRVAVAMYDLPSYLRQDMNYRHLKHAVKGHIWVVVVDRLVVFEHLRSSFTCLLT